MTTMLALALAAVAVSTAGARHSTTTISGAGSTFVAPLVAQWVSPLGSAYGYQLQYSAVGSGAGIASITSRTVDFGASDAPLSPDQFSACNGCEQIPWALGGTSIMYNLPGVKNLLHMDGPTLANIFLGQDHELERSGDRGVEQGRVAAVHEDHDRAPLGWLGTTYNLTDYLSSVSAAWSSQVGRGTAVNWPVGVGGKGSSGVSAIVGQTAGAIGYADVAYAISNHFSYFAMKNRSGKFTTPGLRGILAAASSDQKPAADNSLSIVNPPKKYANAYPISTFTYVIVPLQSSTGLDLKKFLFWAVTKGQTYAPIAPPVRCPKSVLVRGAEKAIAKIHS